MKIQLEEGIILDLDKLKENIDNIKDFRLSYYKEYLESIIIEAQQVNKIIESKLNTKGANEND